MTLSSLPKLLVIDDVLGRRHSDRPNEERANICAHFLLRDVTDDEKTWPRQTVRQPIAEAVFHRGQSPICSRVGDLVENDIDSVLQTVSDRWRDESKTPWSLVLLDLSFYTGQVTSESDAKLKGMPEGSLADREPLDYFGLRILERLHFEFPDLPIVILSSRSRAEVALQFATHGALGFIGSDAEDGPKVLAEAIDRHALIPDPQDAIIGHSRPLMRALRAARQCALNNQNLLIRGESGTGKELIAEYVNRMRKGSADSRPFAVVNSGALTGDLYYSELFGHCKGAFTDAKSNRIGMIEQANGGDLFLDEVANMPPTVQNGLLRVLEEGIVMPLGGQAGDSMKVEVRFVTATHANLELMIAEGAFREDLYERLHRGGMIFVPPLRERHRDLPALTEYFVRMAEAEMGARRRVVTAEAVTKCQEYDWPRNVRQLQNCMYQAVSTFPDLEYLLAKHISLPQPSVRRSRVPEDPSVPAHPLTEIIRRLQDADFDTMSDEELRGRLPQLEETTARLVVRYLRAGLARHRQPDGRLFLQPALQFMTGNPTLAATAAYDIVKRLVKRAHLDAATLASDEVLKQACEKSEKGRVRGKATTGKSGTPGRRDRRGA